MAGVATPILLLASTASELTEACGPPGEASYVCRRVFEATGSEFLAKAADFTVTKPLKILVILVVAWLVVRIVRRAIRRFVEHARDETFQQRMAELRRRTGVSLLDTGPVPSVRRGQRAEAIAGVLRSVTSFVVWAIAGLMVLSELGLNLGPLIAGAGIAGVALGFGAQSLVKDFLSGLFMLVEDQFGIGDVIDAGEASGVVEGMSLRTTRIRDVEGVVWHIPNGEIRRVGNKSQQWARALLDVEVAYDTDLDRAMEVIKRVADEMWRQEEYFGRVILEEPEVWGVESLGASGIAIRVVVKTLPREQWNVARELRRRIKLAFDAEGIEIPFPQQVVWHRGEGRTGEGRTGEAQR